MSSKCVVSVSDINNCDLVSACIHFATCLCKRLGFQATYSNHEFYEYIFVVGGIWCCYLPTMSIAT